MTQLLTAARAGTPGARDHLMEIAYSQFHRMAVHHLADEKACSLQPTALLHEALLRILDSDIIQNAPVAETGPIRWPDRSM
jgi:hypothetical protein